MTQEKQPEKSKKADPSVKVKISELYLVRDALIRAGKYAKPDQFRYGVAKNLKAAEREIDLIEAPLKTPPDEIREYNIRIADLNDKLAARNGNAFKRHSQTPAQIKANEPGDIIYKDPVKAESEFAKLRRDFKKPLDDWKKLVRETNEFIETGYIPEKEDGEGWKWFKIRMSDLPDELSGTLMKDLWPILTDDINEDDS